VKATLRTIVAASVLGGAPSTVAALVTARGSMGGASRTQLEATRAIGTLVPPGRPGVVAGTAVHLAISVAMAELLTRLVGTGRPLRGAAAGLLMGLVNVGVIGRRYPAIRSLPLLPQLADNIAFGLVVSGRRAPRSRRRTSRRSACA
jgi:hypothetical protein